MAAAKPARPWHPGPTVLSDIESLASPSQAPETLRFPLAMVAQFQTQRYHSYPAGHSKEQGGTIVADAKGSLFLQNIGGLASTAGTFSPNLVANDPSKFKVIGVFHTHPYDKSEGSMNGVAFSGGDVGALILTNTILSIVQSGPRTFAYLKTALTPPSIDYTAVNNAANAELAARVKAGQTFQQGSRIIAQARATQYNLAYYQGLSGIVTRV